MTDNEWRAHQTAVRWRTQPAARFPPRTWTQGMWRWWWRTQRIQARESMKAVMDVSLYGAGFVRIDATGVHHVPYHEVMAL